MSADSKGSRKTAFMRKLACEFGSRLYDKYLFSHVQANLRSQLVSITITLARQIHILLYNLSIYYS